MPIITDTITTPDGTCPVTLATPEGDGPWPGVVMYPDASVTEVVPAATNPIWPLTSNRPR